MKAKLRSLLADLSGSLKPKLGSGLTSGYGSAFGPQIIQRICEVVTHRDLAIPVSTQESAIDPNTIAEYLDGTLPPEREVEIEELCLSSDKYLAEVAACRVILDKVSTHAKPPSSSAIERFGGMHKPGPKVSKESSKFRHWLSSRLRRAVRVAAAVLICCGVFVLAKRVADLNFENQSIRNGLQSPSSLTGANPVLSEVIENLPIEPRADPNTFGRLTGHVKGVSPILLRWQPDHTWRVDNINSPVAIYDRLLCLPGLQSQVRLSIGIRFSLLGNLPTNWKNEPVIRRPPILESSVTIQPQTGFDLNLILHRGRIMIINDKPDGEARVRVQFQDEKWDLILSKPGSEAALELRSYYLPGSPGQGEPAEEDPRVELRLFAVHGSVELHVRYDSYSLSEPPGPAAISWDNVRGMVRQPLAMDQPPDWTRGLDPSSKNLDIQQARSDEPVSASMQKALDGLQMQLSDTSSVESFLKDSLTKSEPVDRVLGVYCLSALDDAASLVDVLGSSRQFPQVRVAAINGLKSWIGRNVENDQRLLAVLEKKYSATTAQVVLHLLHGFSPMQSENPETFTTLIGYLKHDDLAIRQLAYQELLAMVPEGGSINYDPVGGRALRERAILEWKKLVPDGIVPKRN
jgi:hypothetical protein